MSESLRHIKRRIRSIESTSKVTRAMEMISIVKLRHAQEGLVPAKDYSFKLEQMLKNILTSFVVKHPLLENRKTKEKITLCFIASDMGLCGSYNHNMFKCVHDFIARHATSKINLVIIGKAGFRMFKKLSFPISDVYTEFHGRLNKEVFNKISRRLVELFLTQEADEVHVAYTRFDSAARLKPVVEKILNVDTGQGQFVEYKAEPDIQTICDELIPSYIDNKIYGILLNAFASEHSARSMAMGEATENASELLDELVRTRNKMRQASITKEIIEVISSVDALKG